MKKTVKINMNEYIITMPVVTAKPSLSNLQNLIVTGNTVIIPNGVYTLTARLSMIGNNITLQAATPGGVVFTGGNISVDISGNNNTLTGIQFVNTSANMGLNGIKVNGANKNDLISVLGNNNTVSFVNIKSVYAYHFIMVYGTSQYTTINNINVQNKMLDASGTLITSMIQLQGNSSVTNNHYIHHCSFQGMTNGNGGDNGCEPIRVGDNVYSTCDLRTIIEYCVFDNTYLADSESISVKSMNNVFRYNTFSNNLASYISFRNGNNNVAYGNFFINSSGIRFKQASNISVYNNYFFQNEQPMTFVDVSKYVNYQTLYHNNINIQNNTFYNCLSIMLDTYDLSNNVFANNILYGDGNGPPLSVPGMVRTLYPNSGLQTGDNGNINLTVNGGSNPLIVGDMNGFNLTGNMYVGTLGQPMAGFTNIDPNLQLNSVGYYSIIQGSPATGYSSNPNAPLLAIPGTNTDQSITYDITGQIRNSQPIDAGCSQITTVSSVIAVNKPLSLTDVGVMYSMYSP